MQPATATGRMALAAVLSACAMAASDAAPGATAATVVAAELPAWVERAGGRVPVRPGLVLEAGDRVRTGGGARARLRLAEGSLVKLGEDAEFHIREADPSADGGVFSGFLDVVKGAFRFTTTALSTARRRDLSIRIAGITAGVRGTDLWGKAAPDRDIVCLIEGDISVRRGDEPAFTMDRPLSFYIAPKNAPALPVAAVDPDQLARWAAETETAAARGVLGEDGAWQVNLASYRDRDAAGRAASALRDDGYPAEVVDATVAGEPWVRVALAGYTGLEGARAAAARLADRAGFTGAWVSRR